MLCGAVCSSGALRPGCLCLAYVSAYTKIVCIWIRSFANQGTVLRWLLSLRQSRWWCDMVFRDVSRSMHLVNKGLPWNKQQMPLLKSTRSYLSIYRSVVSVPVYFWLLIAEADLDSETEQHFSQQGDNVSDAVQCKNCAPHSFSKSGFESETSGLWAQHAKPLAHFELLGSNRCPWRPSNGT